MRSVARQFEVSLHTVQRWVNRTTGSALDQMDWRDRPPIPYRTHRTDAGREDLILSRRHQLRHDSTLGEFGAVAIRREWQRRGLAHPPSIRTIGRILERRGALDGQKRVRRRPPPAGWYLPEVALGQAELDSFDVVEGLVIEGGTEVYVLNGISLHGGLVGSWPLGAISTTAVLTALTEHWGTVGVPRFAQFDNHTLFQGAHHYPDSIGRVIRFCLSLNVTPVFVPPRETGFQAAIESFNARWQAKVWARFHHDSLAELQARSLRYIAAHRQRSAARIEGAPARQTFPPHWRWTAEDPLAVGRLIYLRRTNDYGRVNLLGHTFDVHPLWTHRLVRCEVSVEAHTIQFYALRRREPTQQPLLKQVHYQLKPKWLSK